jgi:hypothetical protein
VTEEVWFTPASSAVTSRLWQISELGVWAYEACTLVLID